MSSATAYRFAFLVLLLMLLAMRVFFMVRVRRAGSRLIPGQEAIAREGGLIVIITRILAFLVLIAVLAMYVIGFSWINVFSFSLPGWLHWTGFVIGLSSVLFWTWTQITLDTRWSANLQLAKNHILITNGPFALIRHPLYTSLIAWSLSSVLLTSNWIFVFFLILSITGLSWRIPKEEQMLLDEFGDKYRKYMQLTGKFFPRISK